jgi:predicted dehydrogenase
MPVSRRVFLAAASAASYRRVLGANDRVGVGFVGFGLIGLQHVHDFRAQPDVAMVALSDVYQPRMEQGVAACGGTARGYRDFRKLLDDREVDAVVVSTPDHWHALITMMACAAGKDVYVEKPLTLFVREGRWMTDVARRHNRIVQVGTQQRSGLHYQRARELLKSGHIGQLLTARMGDSRNIMPGFGNPPDGPAPHDFDYEMWLGPAPERPYNPHRGLYHFRWFWDYSGGQMTNLGAHEVDIVQWVLGAKGPAAVTSTGGRWALQDDGETPDVQDALFEYPKFSALWSHREAGKGMKVQRGLEFIGTKGTLIVNRAGFEVESDMRINPENAIPLYQGMPSGGPKKAAATVATPWIENPEHGKGSEAEQLTNHVRNFLDCIKSRQRPIADVEDGHRTAVACHLANISLKVGRKVRWDPDNEQVIGDSEASAMLERPYRKPWDGVLRSLLA